MYRNVGFAQCRRPRLLPLPLPHAPKKSAFDLQIGFRAPNDLPKWVHGPGTCPTSPGTCSCCCPLDHRHAQPPWTRHAQPLWILDMPNSLGPWTYPNPLDLRPCQNLGPWTPMGSKWGLVQARTCHMALGPINSLGPWTYKNLLHVV